MAKEVLVLEIKVKGGKLSAKELGMNATQLERMRKGTDAATKGMGRMATTAGELKRALAAMGLMVVVYQLGRLSKSFIQAADVAQRFRFRMEAMLGSIKDAGDLFGQMEIYAGSVAHEYEHIMEAATTLTGIMKGGKEEIMAWMPLIGDLGAAANMSFREVMGQFVRMYSAGANTADMFRERGILTMLGFQTQVKITAEETRKHLWDQWEKVDSKFKDLALKLANTWRGAMSMLKDQWFFLRKDIMEAGLFEFLIKRIQKLKDLLREMRAGGAWPEIGTAIMQYVTGFELLFKYTQMIVDSLLRGAKIFIYTITGWEDVAAQDAWTARIAAQIYQHKINLLKVEMAGYRMKRGTFGGKAQAAGTLRRGEAFPDISGGGAGGAGAAAKPRYITGELLFGRGDAGINYVLPAAAGVREELDRIQERTDLIKNSWLSVSDVIGTAFANMASGAMSAGDAIKSALLGALGQICMMWGQFFIAYGLGMQFVLGGQIAWGAVGKGAALMALGGSISGLAGRGGGRGGVGGYGGGAPYASRGTAGATASPQIIIIQSNGRVDRTQGNLLEAGTRAGLSRQTLNVVREQLRTTGSM